MKLTHPQIKTSDKDKDTDMVSTVTEANAREGIRFRNLLQSALTPDENRGINWTAILRTAQPAITRGWTGDELANWCIGDLGPTTTNVGGSVHATVKLMGDMDPPRKPTPGPPPVSEVLAAIRSEQGH